MKKIFALFTILNILSNIAFAANWMPVTDKWDVDLDSIKWKEDNQIVRVWLRNNVADKNELFENKKVEYIYYQELIYPSKKFFITLTEVLYDEKGKTLQTSQSPYGGQVSQIPPSSFYDYFADLFGYVSPKVVEDYKLLNLKHSNFLYFGDRISKPVDDYPLKNVKKDLISTSSYKYKEADYVRAYCKGRIEYSPENSNVRVDCLTDSYAIEFDYAKKWKEAIGQALYYGKITDRKPAVAIIMTSPSDEKYINRIIEIDKNIDIFRIKAFE